MYIEQNTEEIILERMKNRVNDVASMEGSLISNALSPASIEFALAYNAMDEVLARVFPQYAAENGYSEELELRCAEEGIFRKPGTKAIGKIKFLGNDEIMITKGTIVQTQSLLQYVVKEDITINGGFAYADIEALNVGKQYNTGIGTIVELPTQIIGVVSIINEAGISGGTDKETDLELLKRYLLKCRTPATSGNVNHYKLWAMEANGVGDAVVMPTWNGPGTVKIVVLDNNKRKPSQAIVDLVKLNIESNRPIGVIVTVEGTIEVPINISVNVQLAAGADINSVKEQIEDCIRKYLEGIAFKETLVRYTRIANFILDIPPVIDYSDLKVNNGTANIEVPIGNVAVLGEVIVNET